MFGLVIQVIIFFGVASFMWSVSDSLQQIAKDLRTIASRTGSKPAAEDPGDLGQPLLAADRTGAVRGRTMEACGSQQVRAGVADLADTDPAGMDVGEQRPTLQRVVDDLPLGAHPVRVRAATACTRATS